MSLSLRSRVNAELDAICKRNGGLIKQEDVVKFARKKGTALREDFDLQGLWDEKAAAVRARMDYAGRLIRIYVVKDSPEAMRPVRALVSLSEDRKPQSGYPGYRQMSDVLSDEGLRAQLLATARMELRSVRRRYDLLVELAKVWAAIDEDEARKKSRPPAQEGDAEAA